MNASQLDHAPTRPLEDTNSTPDCQLDHAPTLIAGSGGASPLRKHWSSHASKPMRETSESHSCIRPDTSLNESNKNCIINYD